MTLLERWRLRQIYRHRGKLHVWLTYMEKECPEAGLAPCGYGAGSICECHAIARPVMRTRTGYAGNMPRRPEPGT